MADIRVAECRFLRLGCTTQDHPLFRSEYARSNRGRGVKILRCFPHCCPEHAPRCYCGCSIHLLVTFSVDVQSINHDDLLVCARFEPSRVVPLWAVRGLASQSHERKLEPGETVELPVDVMNLGGGQPAKGAIWIRAERESGVKQKKLPKNALLYVINNRRFPKWFYSYDSSITRAQREMTHHFAAYVFRVSNARPLSDEQCSATVLARHASTPFTLISYRRAAEARGAQSSLPAVAGAAQRRDRAAVRNSDVSALASSSRQLQALQIDADAGVEATRALLSPLKSPGDDESKGNDALFWQLDPDVKEAGVAEKAQHLIILWRFMGLVTLADVGFCMDKLDSHIRRHWLAAANALGAPPDHLADKLEELTASFSLGLFRRSHNSPLLQSSSSALASSAPVDASQEALRDRTLLRACAHLLIRAFSSHTIQQLIRSAFVTGSDVPKKSQLRRRFVQLLLNVYDALGEVLLCVPPDLDLGQGPTSPRCCSSVPALVDDILSMVYGQSRFESLQREASALLLEHQTPSSLSMALSRMFGAFTAQARETVIAVGRRQRGVPQRQLVAWPAGIETSKSLWNRRWLLEPGSIRLMGTTDDPEDPSCGPSLLELTHWLHEFACLDMAIQDDATCCSVRSALTLTSELAPMQLVLDGRLRFFRVLPSGVSSMAMSSGNWSFSDYAAIFSDGGLRVLELLFYLLAEAGADTMEGSAHPRTELGVEHASAVDEGATFVRRISLTFTLEEELDVEGIAQSESSGDMFVFVHGVVDDAVYMAPRTALTVVGGGSRPKLAEMASAARAAVLTELQWTQVLEMQAGYIGISSAGGHRG